MFLLISYWPSFWKNDILKWKQFEPPKGITFQMRLHGFAAVVVVVWLLSHVRSLQPHGLQHFRLPCASPSPRVCSNSCPLSQWCYPTVSSSVIPFSSCLQSFPAFFSIELALCIRRSEYWSFSFSNSSSSEHSGLISFRIDWLDLLLSKGLSRVFSGTMIWKHRFFDTQPSLRSNTSVYDYWRNHSFDYMDLCWQSDGSAF